MLRIKQFLSSGKVYNLELVFKIVYIIHLIASFNSYIIGSVFLKGTLIGTMLLGSLLLLCRILAFRRYTQTPALLMLVLFLVSFAIPSFLIYRYALVDSVKTMIWMTFQFFLLYAFDSERNITYVKKELGIVSAGIAAFITIENLVSVAMAFVGYFRIHKTFEGNYVVTGLPWWGRLYGVHSDPNYACVYSMAAIMIAAYFFVKYKSKILRFVLALAAVINLTFISFSGSRSGLVSLLAAATVFVLTYFIVKYKDKRFRVIKSVALVAVVCVMLVGLNSGIVKGFNTAKSLIYATDGVDNTDNTQSAESTESTESTESAESAESTENVESTESAENTESTESAESTESSKPEISETVSNDTSEPAKNNISEPPDIGRDENEINHDPTNRRTDIWKSAFEIFSKNAMFGIGYENVLGYAYDEMPETYIVNNDLKPFDAFHNVVMDIMVSQGAVGILIAGAFAVIFIVFCVKQMLKRRKHNDNENQNELCLSLSVCVGVLASSMFLSHVFFVNIATTGIFWLFIGYLGYFLYVTKE